jgi:hypothetical protein
MDETFFMLNGEKLQELDEQGCIQETDFQALLERYPKLLPGSQIDPDNPRRWMLVSREVPVPARRGAPGAFGCSRPPKSLVGSSVMSSAGSVHCDSVSRYACRISLANLSTTSGARSSILPIIAGSSSKL